MQVDISIDSKKFKCSFSIVDKVTFIEGDSGVGKTQFSQKVMSSATTVTTIVSNGFDLTVLSKKEFNRSLSIAKRNIEKYTEEKFPINDKDKSGKLLFAYWSEEDNFPIFDSIIIIDDEDFISSREFSAYFNADKYNYYIIISRREVAGISYSIDSIFKFRTDGTYHWLEKSISYDVLNTKIRKTVDWILVEGSASDFIFFSEMFQSERVINSSYKGIDTTGGRAKIINLVMCCFAEFKYKKLLLLVDICAFGSNIKALQELANINNIVLFFIQDYQSFEFLLLHSKMINDQELTDFVADNVLFYKSREDLYEARLESLTINMPYHYSKKIDKFPVCYYKKCCSNQKQTASQCLLQRNFNGINKFKALFDKTKFSILNEIEINNGSDSDAKIINVFL